MKKKTTIVAFLIVPLMVYLLCLVPRSHKQSRIIYYTIPDYYTSMAGSKLGMTLAKRIGSQGRIRVGHAGLLVEDENGDVYRYDYGRFPTCYGSAKLPQLQGNWVKEYVGNFRGKSMEELTNVVGEKILNRFHRSGRTVHFYTMEGDGKAAVDYIEKDANDPNRYHYVWYLDHTCCGRARSAFDHGRTSKLGHAVSYVTDVVENVVPNGSTIAQSVFDRNVTAISGVSVEGNAPLINTTRYTYRR